MRPFALFVTLFLTLPVTLSAQYFPDGGSCETLNIDPQTSITFYGDSRGQLIHVPGYGNAPNGWSSYLEIGGQGPWVTQNQAVSAWWTSSIYSHVLNCNMNHANEYKTALRYAVNAGGNDFIGHGFLAVIAPWRIVSSTYYINDNQRKLVKLFKLALARRGSNASNLLWTSTYPAVSRGPLTGPPARKCFPGGFNVCVLPIQPDTDYTNPDVFARMKTWVQEYKQQLVSMSVLTLATGSSLDAFVLTISGAAMTVAEFLNDSIASVFGKKQPTSGQEAYTAWIKWNQDEMSLFTMPSFMIMLNHPLEADMAAQEGINFVDLYPYFVDYRDCLAGGCWSANGVLFQDVVHPNVNGYALEGSVLGAWFKANGWDQPFQPATVGAAITQTDLDAAGLPGSLDPLGWVWDVLAWLAWLLYGVKWF